MLNPVKATATALLTAICTVTLTGGIAPRLSSEALAQNRSTFTTPPTLEESSIYDKAREDLSPNLYMLYRIVERIARANGLTNHPWRVVVADDTLINAYATEVNLVIVHFGLLDQMAGDISALACVVGHEMAHHTERHIAIRTSRVADWQEETRNANSREFQERMASLAREHEQEADMIGYQYSVTAGFDPSGCVRGLEMLSRLPGTMRDSATHPSVPRRIEAIQALIDATPPEVLRSRGQLGLTTSDPLSYEMLEDKEWLRINSVRGGSFVEDWNRLFPDEIIDPNFTPPEDPEGEETETDQSGE
ncbi:M48 family metallopeptidase [Spirulina sp. CCNP1310]|uniref:M48 family metallopeptidase n=1 Tax=Spirulina sp. CCNP1310 TaxID=3110249 RepID=UPI002B20505C|nr:M48 family metallopeptidase [Spirulina sp. CCNP1310]MEA5417898.1 M48 family metallopeptidase [Spirulina sp. CCNP1310]